MTPRKGITQDQLEQNQIDRMADEGPTEEQVAEGERAQELEREQRFIEENP